MPNGPNWVTAKSLHSKFAAASCPELLDINQAKSDNRLMRVTVEIKSEPVQERNSPCAGQTVDVGRSHHASFPIPHDQWMSSLHFRVECDELHCQLRDLNSRNGTSVNGGKVTQVILADGDTILAGQTKFGVHIAGAAAPDTLNPAETQDAPEEIFAMPPVAAALHHFGHWTLDLLPEQWELISEKGICNRAEDSFATSLMFAEYQAGEDVSLSEHVETLIQQYLDAISDCRTDGAMECEVQGADTAIQFLLEYPQRGDVALRQQYVCVQKNAMIGMAVLTTSQAELDKSGPLLTRMVAGLAWEE